MPHAIYIKPLHKNLSQTDRVALLCLFHLPKKSIRLIQYAVALFLFSQSVSGQDLEQIPDSLFFKANGGVNLGLTAYSSNGMDNRRDPYSYLLSANLTINISDVINMPFSATFSSGSNTFSQPRFAQVGISPKYKAITVHAGHRSMQFSPYTLGGIMFLGGGVEIDQKENYWQLKLMSGRLAKGISYHDNLTGKVELPSFERWGFGGMVTVGNDDYSGDIILFKASDFEQSANIPDSAGIAPEENLAFGINTRIKISDRLKLKTEYAGSAYSSDIRMEEILYDRYTYLNNLGGLFTPRLSSSYSNAYSIGLSYGGETFSFGVDFKQVDPDYITLGSTYISNDFRNLTLSAAKSMFDNRFNLSGSFGNQTNNLDGDKAQTTKRVIGSLQAAIKASDRLNFSGNYANYSSSSNPTYIHLVDSIKYVQVSKNYVAMVSYSIPGEVTSHNFMLNVTAQTSDMLNNNATEVVQSNTLSKTALLSYTSSYQPLSVSLNTSLNITQFDMETGRSQTIGPVVSLSRPFFNRKVSSSLSYSHMSSANNGNNNSTAVVRLNLNWKVLPKHTVKFNAGTTFMNRMVSEEGGTEMVKKKSNETRLVLNYNMSF